MAQSTSQTDHRKSPVMRVTQYDQVSSSLIAVVLALIISVLWLSVVWFTNRLPQTENDVALEMVDLAGGAEDGSPDEELLVESPEDPVDDPSQIDTPTEENQVEEMLDSVVELSDKATQQVQQQMQTDLTNSGKVGSAAGTGKRALGFGPGKKGLPREQRWFIKFSDRGSLIDYARQLDYFKIELGALMRNGKMIYLSKVSSDKPVSRTASSGENEKRLYMTWQGGQRRTSDLSLFKKAGYDVTGAILFHFYPKETENRLLLMEQKYRNKKFDEIRRTYFTVRGSRGGYDFEVTRQTYFR
ncbi:hypothetical protein [Gimesia panareensis]|uniref:Uncharacterized protein n=1 Tax=Gimesia panareensis TaxID=2527978 RepID=A0A518A7Y3_9PLAN|nr:hypothetical protein [Gimesia panareensis]QDU50850.1 hypothetical protein Pan110_32100 [Gimesia panareensis]QDV18717.1 hypothetical protein Pan153_33770 [Gimesia panareensis]